MKLAITAIIWIPVTLALIVVALPDHEPQGINWQPVESVLPGMQVVERCSNER